MTHAEDAHQLFAQVVGRPEGSGAWLAITQERVDAFADVTEDHQFIHVDPAAAAQYSPWGTTIAHGFLTLSLLTVLTSTIEQPTERAAGLVMGVNYGFDKVRFVNPVKVGARIRASTVLASAEQPAGRADGHRRDRGRGQARARRGLGHPPRLQLSRLAGNAGPGGSVRAACAPYAGPGPCCSAV